MMTLYICAVLPVSTAAITIRRWSRGACCSKSHQLVLKSSGGLACLALNVCSLPRARTARRARFRVCSRCDQPAAQIHTLQASSWSCSIAAIIGSAHMSFQKAESTA